MKNIKNTIIEILTTKMGNMMGNVHEEEYKALRLEATMRLDQLQYPHMDTLPTDVPGLLHDLQVHKIELEMQNDQLQSANLALEESSQRYRDRYDFAPIGYFSISDQGLITEFNRKAASMFGLKHNKLNQYRFAQFVHDRDKSRWQDLFLGIKNQEQGEELLFDVQLINNDGGSFHASINCLRMNDDVNSEILRLAVIDITDKKVAIEKQQALDEQHQEILDSSMNGFWIVDLNGRFLEVNATYCKMSGYTLTELLTMKISDIEAIESVSDTLTHIKKVISIGQDQFESKHRRKDGSLFDVRVKAQIMHSEGGRLAVFLQDISSIKAITEQVEALQLEQQVMEGTTQQLQTALDSERSLSVAVGIVMGQQQVGKDTAMKLLRKRARDQNLKLNDLATILVSARETLNFEIKL